MEVEVVDEVAIGTVVVDAVEEEETSTYDVASLLNIGKDFMDAGHTLDPNVVHSNDAYDATFKEQWFNRRIGDQKPKQQAKKYALSRGRGIPVISKEILNNKKNKNNESNDNSSGGTDKAVNAEANKIKTVRKYVVASWPAFEKLYPKIRLGDRNFYENVFLGEPCRLYMDIEAECVVPLLDDNLRVTNEYVSRRQFVLDLICMLCKILSLLYPGVLVTRVFVIDSSSKAKFSQHVVCHMDEDRTRFRSSADLSKLVDYLAVCSYLRLLQQQQQQMQMQKQNVEGGNESARKIKSPFHWSKKSGGSGDALDRGSISTLDCSVYGNKGGGNEFRVLGSTKFGKDRYLTLQAIYDVFCIAGEGEDPHDVNFVLSNDEDKDMPGPWWENPTYRPEVHDAFNSKFFYDTLVCFIPKGHRLKKLLTFQMDDRRFKEFIKRTYGIKRFNSHGLPLERVEDGTAASSRVSIKRSYANKTEEEREGYVDSIKARMRSDASTMPSDLAALCTSFCFGDEETGERHALFEKIGFHISSHYCSRMDGDDVEFISYKSGSDGSRVVSYRTSSKWCEIKDDYHGSNHVYYAANLVTKSWWMGCFSPSCCKKVQFERIARDKENEKKRKIEASKRTEAIRPARSIVVVKKGNLTSGDSVVASVPTTTTTTTTTSAVSPFGPNHEISYSSDSSDSSDSSEDGESRAHREESNHERLIGMALSVLTDGPGSGRCSGERKEIDVGLWLDINTFLKKEKDTIESYLNWVKKGKPLTSISSSKDGSVTETEPNAESTLGDDVAMEDKKRKREAAQERRKNRTRTSFYYDGNDSVEKKRMVEALL